MNLPKIILFTGQLGFIYAAVHLALLAIVLVDDSVAASIVLGAFDILILILVFQSKKLDKEKPLPEWKGMLFHVFFCVLGGFTIWLGVFIQRLLPYEYYVSFRQQASLYVSLGVGLLLIGTVTIILFLTKYMVKE